jgi:hypothetical protein
MSSKNRKRVLVIAHDAGGTEVIAAYIRTHAKQYDFCSYIAGPAVRIFRREHLPFKAIKDGPKQIGTIVATHRDCAFALLGTGWMTEIEAEALVKAKQTGVKAVVYLESWTDYRKRFGYPKKNWRDKLPDELWVGDEYAQQLATNLFVPYTSVRFVRNQYFVDIKERFNLLHRGAPQPNALLFLSDAVPEARQLFAALLFGLSLRENRDLYVLLRFHPADKRCRYDKIIQRYRGQVRVRKSRDSDIVRDLLMAKAVIGTESVAMVPAALVGKKTINVLPLRRKSVLPFPQIARTRSVEEALRLI